MSGVLTAHSPISIWITNSTYTLTPFDDRLSDVSKHKRGPFFLWNNGDEMGFVLVSKTIAYENMGVTKTKTLEN